MPLMLEEARAAVCTLLRFAGIDPDQDVIRDTPDRYLRALVEMTEGYEIDPYEHLGRVFEDPTADGMIVVKGITFASLCEHHLLPFHGTVTIGYLPAKGRLLGLSKLPRLVNVYARRLQVQERLGRQLADVIHQELPALGAGVVIRAEHSCMTVRGVCQDRAVTTTTALAGLLDEDPVRRLEFMTAATT